MPTDKVTQLSLGLNHGLPSWYKRAHAPNLHSPASILPQPTPPTQSSRLAGNWRQLDNAPHTSPTDSIASVMRNSRSGPRKSSLGRGDDDP